MRFAVLGLLLPVVLGCAGKNVVAGDEKTKSQQLEAAVPSWCETTCRRLQACPPLPCDCTGDLCDCPGTVGGSDCSAGCLQAMAPFTKGDDACATAGEHFRQCVDAASCSQLQQGETCEPIAADQAACPAASASDPGSGDDVAGSIGPNGASSGGSSTTSGVSSGGAPSMTDAPGSAGAAGAPVSCMGAWGTAGASSGGPPPTSAVVCEEGLGGCSDGHEYSWLCAKGSQGETACSCLVDSQVTGGFDPGAASCPTQPQVNAGCNWNIAQ